MQVIRILIDFPFGKLNSFEADKWPMSSYVIFYNKKHMSLSLSLCALVTVTNDTFINPGFGLSTHSNRIAKCILVLFTLANMKGCFTVGYHFLIENQPRTNSFQLNTFLGSQISMEVLLWEVLSLSMDLLFRTVEFSINILCRILAKSLTEALNTRVIPTQILQPMK